VSHGEKGITLGLLSATLIAMAIILILALVKVYLSNQVYLVSRKIGLIESEVSALKEEQGILKMRVEQLRYKNKITDTIFSMEENKEITDAAEEETPQ